MPGRACFVMLTALVLFSFLTDELRAFETGHAHATSSEISGSGSFGLIGQAAKIGIPEMDQPAGAYLSWLKLLLIAVVFVIWVRTTDWVNRDSMRIGDRTGMPPEAWNPVTVGSFLVGLLVVLFVPVFYAGFPIYVLSAWTPLVTYFFMRRSKIKASPDIKQQLSTKPGQAPPAPVLPQDEGAAIDFSAAGSDSKEQQVNLIRARQSAGFTSLKDMLANALSKRADVVMFDFTRDRVAGKFQVDGAWHPVPMMDRPTGDAMLASLKSLAGLNIAERKAKQTGEFNLKTAIEKAGVELMTHGVPTGERVQFKFNRQRKSILSLGKLGMFPEMVERLKKTLNKTGMAIISAPPGEGLSSSWQGALSTADRLTRDCLAVVDDSDTDTIVENIAMRRFDPNSGKQKIDLLKATLLSQPDFVAFPEVDNAELMDLLTLQVTTQHRSVLLRTTASSAADALLKMFSKSEDRSQFARAISHVTGQRLIRRLCDECKQEVRVPPKTIQQLGGDPKQQTTLFNPYRLPPPEQRVDEKGKPIEFPPCPVCGGIGYIGRIGVFELIEMDDHVRSTLLQSPKAGAIEAAAAKAGKIPIVKQAYKLVLLGVTSLAEVQRVFK